MQNYKAINKQFSVTGALSVGDMEQAKKLGLSTVINNLPDSEVLNGFTTDVARAKAKSLGLNYHYLPVTGVSLNDQDNIDQFRKIISKTKSPVLAHCKSGTRSAVLWGFATSQSKNPSGVIKELAAAHFEFDFLEDEFEEQREIGLARTITKTPAIYPYQMENTACR